MSSRREQIRKRWRYLVSKGMINFVLSAATFAAFVCALEAIFILLCAFYFKNTGQIIFTGILLSLMLFFDSWISARLARQILRTARQLSYVPPVTAETLPAEEVLLRGAEEPASEQSKVLLRSIASGPESASQELLRCSQQG